MPLENKISGASKNVESLLNREGEKKPLKKQIAMGKLTARERITSILDKGSFNEYDLFV